MPIAKESETFAVFGDDGAIHRRREGVYRRDTRYLKVWRWAVADATVLSTQEIESGLWQHLAVTDQRRVQQVGCDRRLRVRARGFDDHLILTNTSLEPQQVEVTLTVEGEFLDMMHRWAPAEDDVPVAGIREAAEGWTLERQCTDGVVNRAQVSLSPPFSRFGEGAARWVFTLAQGETAMISASVDLIAGDGDADPGALPDYASWRASFPHPPQILWQASHARAVDDLRLLLLPTTHGPYPAAGLPWFVAAFGRDAILTAHMLLAQRPDLALSVLRYLAAHQGQTDDPFSEEAPGKILHEVRHGELSRRRRIPFGRYFGSIDATPLFVILLDAYVARTGHTDVLEELSVAWRGALSFILRHQGADGLLSFTPSGSGLTVQSWKDSPDSMNHADGSQSDAPLAVAEVQGYAIAALRAGAGFFERSGEVSAAHDAKLRAARLQAALHAQFWMEDLATYAMALDRHGQPLRVLSSDPGHLLWAGVVPEDVAPQLVKTLMSERLWSGWGLRTLGVGEVRHNPVSYHNGGVWPHDTAVLAGGLARYGFEGELRTVAAALFDLAGSQPLSRMPELVSGFARSEGLAPVPYSHACQPQAWSAAALPYLVSLLADGGDISDRAP